MLMGFALRIPPLKCISAAITITAHCGLQARKTRPEFSPAVQYILYLTEAWEVQFKYPEC